MAAHFDAHACAAQRNDTVSPTGAHLIIEQVAGRAERRLHQLSHGRAAQQVCGREVQRPLPPQLPERRRIIMLAADGLEDAAPEGSSSALTRTAGHESG